MPEPASSPSIRVVLADDHAVLRAGLRMLVNLQPDMTVVGEAADAEGAVQEVEAHAPDVIVLDLAMPGGGSIEAIQRIRDASPTTRVLVLSMHDESSYLRAVIAAGGAGYVTKRAADTELLTAIRTVHAAAPPRRVHDRAQPGVRDSARRPAGFAPSREAGDRGARRSGRRPGQHESRVCQWPGGTPTLLLGSLGWRQGARRRAVAGVEPSVRATVAEPAGDCRQPLRARALSTIARMQRSTSRST